tara:strand:+ start:145 stop:453 length:309 start_codon:yes stop_codon:yes gene_type:complete
MGFMDKMKQAKDMYGNMKKIQQELDKIQVDGFSKNKLVIVTVKGNHQISDIQIDNQLQNTDLKEIEKNILYACNDAMSKVEKEIKSKMGNMMNMPGGPKLPF